MLLGAAIPAPADTEISTTKPPPFGAVGLGGLEFETNPDGQTVVYMGSDGVQDSLWSADGGGGTDTCIAETVIDCEA